jgi:putative hydrolase of the HAD superfamily
MKAVKNILFDLGAVLIDIDFEKVCKSFEDIGIKDFDKQYSQLAASTLFEDLEKGKISDTFFYKEIQKQLQSNIPSEEIRNAWNSILLDFRIETMQYLTDLKKDYNLFLLSNTNAIHLNEINLLAQQQLHVEELDVYFTKAYYSFKMGMRKPNADIFEFVLKDAGIEAGETFFIDDSAPNIITAQKMGFKTHLLLKGEMVEGLSLFEKMG